MPSLDDLQRAKEGIKVEQERLRVKDIELDRQIKLAKRMGQSCYVVTVSYTFESSGSTYANTRMVWAGSIDMAKEKIKQYEDYIVYKGKPAIGDEHGPALISHWETKVRLLSELQDSTID